MKLCFLVDARSPIAQNWIQYFIDSGHETHVISTYPFSPNILTGATHHMVPLAFSSLAGAQQADAQTKPISRLSSLLSRLRSGHGAAATTFVHHWIGPIDVYRHRALIRTSLERIKPDLLHAMRLPYEGILAGLADADVPLVISTWGNDLTLFANQYPLVGKMTRRALGRVDALHCDCERDLRLASNWGFDKTKPAIILPGNGGVRREMFSPRPADESIYQRFSLPRDRSFVINPRGFRPYVRNDTFFRSIPLILKERPDAFFLGVAMEKNPVAEEWIRRLGVSDSVALLPMVSAATMAELFRLSVIALSPSDHDGTPNTLLEAMACGCLPIAGDIESVREWITPDVNGVLCDQSNPESVAAAVVSALRDDDLRSRAAIKNGELIDERADYQRVMIKAEDFYHQVMASATRRNSGHRAIR